MPKDTKEPRYYQFPLCLLQPVARGEIGADDLVQMIVSWTLVEGGRRFWETLDGTEEEKREEVRWEIGDAAERGEVSGVTSDDPLHLRIFKFNQMRLRLTLGSIRHTVHRYKRLKAYRDNYLRIVQDATGNDTGDMLVRVRHDIVWEGLGDGDIVMPLRRFRVLAGYYAVVGRSNYKFVTNEHIQHTSAGYKSQAAYEAHIEHQADVLRIDGDALPPAPDAFTGKMTPQAKEAGHFRYDSALAYYRQHIADVPLAGPDGMFEATLTRDGAVFTLRDRYFPADGAAPTTGKTDTADLFDVGDRVIFRADVEDHPLCMNPSTSWHLKTGTVEDAHHNGLTISADDGHTYDVSRTDGRPAPLHFFEDEVANVQTRTAADDVRLTYEQVRYTRDKLLDTKWLHMFGDGRRCYYSNSLTTAKIEPKVTKGKDVRLERQIAQEEAKLRQRQKLQGKRDRLEALRAANAQVNGEDE